MTQKVTIKNKKISKAIGIPDISVPKYSKSVINNSNGYAKATKPENVSQVSETIKVFRDDDTVPNHSLEEWEKWYNEHYPEAIKKATDAAWKKFQEVRDKLAEVKREHIEAWERDLIINKTYSGLVVQDAIIKHIAKELGVNSRLGDTNDEKHGIDGYINDIPVQVKADTYIQAKPLEHFAEGIVMITYSKDSRTKDITFSYNPDDFVKE